MNAAGATKRSIVYLTLRPFEPTLNSEVENFHEFCLELLRSATIGPLEQETLSWIHHEFLGYVILLTASTLCCVFAEGLASCSVIFAMKREDVMSHVRQSYLSRRPQDDRVEQLLQSAVTEATEKINFSLALCPDTMLRDLRQNMERGPGMVLYHARRVMSFLMCNSAAGDGLHKNSNIADHLQMGMGDAERPRFRAVWHV